MSEMIEIFGVCDDRFRRLREILAEQFAAGSELGSAVAVRVDGKPVVDLWAGHADPARARLWERDTLVNVFSTTKGILAICALRLAEQGLLELDAPVARYWPEFGAAGKGDLPVRWLLSHRAGLAALRSPIGDDAIFDWDTMTAALAAEEPWWEPGSKHGYHLVTYGWLVGEVIRRITGLSPGQYLSRELAGPLGLDFHVGLDPVHDARTAQMVAYKGKAPDDQPNLFEVIAADLESVTAKAFINPPIIVDPRAVNSRAWRGAEIPGANGHGTARSIAQLYGILACGGQGEGLHVLGSDWIDLARSEESCGADEVLRLDTRFGLGFMLPQPHSRFGAGQRAFGHPGAGGSLGCADPEARVGFGYVTNRMGPHILVDPRANALLDAVYAAL